jgi:UDP-glucose 4-epimerase
MKALITGSSGRLGAAVARALPADMSRIGLDLVAGAETTHQGDMADAGVLRRLMTGVDVVFHLAALHAPHVGRTPKEAFRRANVEGTAALLEAALAARVPRFVFASTTSVYGCTSRAAAEATWVTEDLSPNPEDIYDETKLQAEELCRHASGPAFRVVVLRVSRCFPEPPHLLALYRLYRGVDLRDAARAHVLAATAPLGPYSLFNVSADTPFERKDCRRLWTEPWNVIDERVDGLRREFDERGWPRSARIDRVYVIDKAKTELGYGPEHGVRAVLGDRETGRA